MRRGAARRPRFARVASSLRAALGAARTSLAALIAALLCACGQGEATNAARAHAAPAAGFELRSVRYLLALQPGRAQRDAQGAVTLLTNGGARVLLTRALLSTHSATLVPCAPLPPEQPAARGAWFKRELLGVPRARAGHTGHVDPSAVQDGVVEDMRMLGAPGVLGERSFPAARYCRVHYLVGGAREGQRGGAPELLGTSLLIEGRLLAPAVASGALQVRSRLAHGNLSELSTLLPAGARPSGRVEITFTRELGSLLDDLDLINASPKELERGALRNLLAHARVTARWF